MIIIIITIIMIKLLLIVLLLLLLLLLLNHQRSTKVPMFFSYSFVPSKSIFMIMKVKGKIFNFNRSDKDKICETIFYFICLFFIF